MEAVPEQDVPFKATLAGPWPKSTQSQFRSEWLMQAFFSAIHLSRDLHAP
jgi:hypothetical protein